MTRISAVRRHDLNLFAAELGFQVDFYFAIDESISRNMGQIDSVFATSRGEFRGHNSGLQGE